jgi:CRISPR-associated endonuclease/helicase Cas3
MNDLRLRLAPVYSEQAEPDPALPLPPDLVLARHQMAVLDAYRDPEIDVIFDTAMTGDGKTLAAYLPLLLGGRDGYARRRVIATYPTNELLRDQRKGVEANAARFGRTLDLKEMYGAEITRLQQQRDDLTRADMVRQLLGDSTALLTNPDLFHLLMSYHYGYNQRRELVQRVQANFDYYIFDEFHIFEAPQRIAILNAINAIAVEDRPKAGGERHKVIFLSATPDEQMQTILRNSGLNYKIITGTYHTIPGDGRRRILAPCQLQIVGTDADHGTETWVLDHAAELLDFYRTYPDSKGAIIVTSVATAHRLVDALRPLFAAAGLTVCPNTGLTSRAARDQSYQADLLIGTSTVDVGVDFHINLLVFEAGSSAEFLQRFGRLGRHAGYTDPATDRAITFAEDSYRAYALCPNFVRERIATALSLDPAAPAEPATPLDRPRFSNEVIAEAFPTRQQFRSYTRRWAALQAAPYIVNIDKPRWRDAPDNYGLLREALIGQFARSFSTETKTIWAAIKRYKRDKQDKVESVLLDEVCNFRGSSLGCAVWDTTDGELKPYNLLYMLANSEFEVLTEAAFMAEVRRRGLAEYDYQQQQFYIRVIRYLEERDNFRFSNKSLHLSKDHRDKLNHAVVLNGFRVADSRQRNIGEINRRLETLPLVCTITTEWGDRPRDLKRQLNLPHLFPVHSLTTAVSPACIAFGKAALLLDSLLWWRKNKGDDPAFFDFTPPDDDEEEE